MYLFVCHYKLKPGTRDALLAAIKQEDLEARFHREPGNIEYSYLVPTNEDEADVIRVLECWSDKDAFDAHKNCEATKVWRTLNDQYVIGKDNHGYLSEST